MKQGEFGALYVFICQNILGSNIYVISNIKREDDLLQAWNLLHDFCLHVNASPGELARTANVSFRESETKSGSGSTVNGAKRRRH